MSECWVQTTSVNMEHGSDKIVYFYYIFTAVISMFVFLYCDDDENNFTCLLMLHTSLMFLQSSKEMTYSWKRTLRNQRIMDIT